MHIRRSKLTRLKHFFAAMLLIASMAISLVSPPVAQAAVSIDSIDDKVTQWLYYRGIWACIGNFGEESNDDYTLTKKEVLDGKWFHDDKKGFGYLGPGLDDADDNDGIVDCKDGSPIDRATEDYFGFSDEVEMLCALDDAMDDRGAKDAIKPSIGDGDCERSDKFEIKSSKDNGDGNWRGSFTDILTESLKDSGGRPRFDIGENANSQAWYYWLGKRGIEVFCGDNTPISQGVSSSAGSSKDIVNVTSVDPTTGKITAGINYYLANDDRDQDSEIADVYYARGSHGDAADRTCLELAALTNDNAEAYAAYVAINPGEDLTPNDGGGGTNPSGSTGPVCSAGALGWVICPLIELMQGITESVASLLDGLLRLNPLTESSGGGGIYKIWQSVLNIANVALVIGFLAVIFSQATSYGLSSYGAKRMLPRIIAAAILMNISFFICQVLVDISNILGAGAAQLVQAASGAGSFSDSVTQQTSGLQNAVAVGITIAVLVFFLLGPVVLGFLAVFLTVAARYAVIVLLVLVAPLAFAAWILPNTEQYFKKWWKLFINMLLLYPMVMFVFAAAIVASQAVAAQADEVDGLQGAVMQIMALVVMALPLFSMPLLFKASGGILGRIDDMTKRGARQGAGKAKGRFDNSNFGKYRAQKKAQLRQQELAGTYGGKNKLRAIRGRASRGIYGSRVTGGYGSSVLDGANQKREEVTERAATYASRNPELARAMLRYAEHGDAAKAAREQGLDAASTQTLAQLSRQGVISPGVSAARVAAAGLAQGGKLTLDDVARSERVISGASLSGQEKERQLGQMAGDIIGGAGKSGMVQHGNWGVRGGRLAQDALGSVQDDLLKKSFADVSYNSFREGTGGQEALSDLIATNDNYRASAVAALGDGRVNDRVKDHIRTALSSGGFDVPPPRNSGGSPPPAGGSGTPPASPSGGAPPTPPQGDPGQPSIPGL